MHPRRGVVWKNKKTDKNWNEKFSKNLPTDQRKDVPLKKEDRPLDKNLASLEVKEDEKEDVKDDDKAPVQSKMPQHTDKKHS